MARLPVIVIRPEPGLSATLSAARDVGLEAEGHPLFAAEPVAWTAPDLIGYVGLLAGSGNVFRLGGPALTALTALPVYAVGEATAEAARNAGFVVARSGSGGLQVLTDDLAPSRYLRLAGEAHVTLTPPDGVVIDTRTVYRIAEKPFSHALTDRLAKPALILLHSAEAARHFAAECERCGIDHACLSLACLAPRIAEAAGGGWHRCEAASTPDDAALLALARQMCETG